MDLKKKPLHYNLQYKSKTIYARECWVLFLLETQGASYQANQKIRIKLNDRMYM